MRKLTDDQVKILADLPDDHDSRALLAREVQQLRAAKAADAERIRDVVMKGLRDYAMCSTLERLDGADRVIADRVAEQLATPADRLSAATKPQQCRFRDEEGSPCVLISGHPCKHLSRYNDGVGEWTERAIKPPVA